jgi:hypothetical protein
MPNKHPQMKLSREEQIFLHQWMHEEAHFGAGAGHAKRLQFEHGVLSSDLAALIAAAIPSPVEQATASLGPPADEAAPWPWSAEALSCRLAEARALLSQRSADGLGFVPRSDNPDKTEERLDTKNNSTANARTAAP